MATPYCGIQANSSKSLGKIWSKRIAILRKQGLIPSEPKSQVLYLHRYPKWTVEQDDFLRENFRILPDADVAFVVERTIAACEQRARKLGIERPATTNNPSPLSLPQVPQLSSITTMPTGTTRLELIEGTGGIGGGGGGDRDRTLGEAAAKLLINMQGKWSSVIGHR